LLRTRPNLPVVFLTADVTEETRRKCQAAGAASTLLKPVDKSTLLSTLGKVIHPTPDVPRPVAASVCEFCCLVVDDVATNRLLATHFLRKVLGDLISVAAAESGQAAIDYVHQHPRAVDLILMDVKMPGMDGVEATTRIRASPACSKTMQIIGVTGLDDAASARRCTDAGMNAVLVKPLDADELRKVLHVSATPPTEAGSTATAVTPGTAGTAAKTAIGLLFNPQFTRDMDPALRQQVLQEWRASSQSQLQQLHSLRACREWPQLNNLAHALKGASAQLGAIRVAQIAHRVEAASRLTDPAESDISAELTELEKALAETLSSLQL
jgi:CheY-like chemotaxis protein